jgi:hypothetical protein
MNKSLLLIPILGILLTSGCQLFEDDLGTNNGVLAVAIPTTTEDFISDNYPDYDIDSADEDDICDDVPVYEVELENGSGPDIDLYFDLDWNFCLKRWISRWPTCPQPLRPRSKANTQSPDRARRNGALDLSRRHSTLPGRAGVGFGRRGVGAE